MHLPASLKLIGVALLSAFLIHAAAYAAFSIQLLAMLTFADRLPGTDITITELTSEGKVVWQQPGGYLFTFVKNVEPISRDDMKYGVQIAKYKTEDWNEDGYPLDVYAFTAVQDNGMIYERELPKVFPYV